MSTTTTIRKPKRTPGDSYIQSLAKGLAVIKTFSADAPHQTLTEVAARARLDRAGARRILLTLKTLGYVCQHGRDFLPTPSILHLGYSYLSTIPWWTMAERKMVELVEATNESASLGVLSGSHIVAVVRVHATKNPDAVPLIVGRKSPAYCTAIGRVLLGALPEDRLLHLLHRRRPTPRTDFTVTSIPALTQIIERDRRQGWSLVNREYNSSMRSIAVPVYSQTHQLMAAISVSGTPDHISSEKMIEAILPQLKRTAARLWQ